MSYDCQFPRLRLIQEQGHYFCGRDLAWHGLSSSVTLAWAPDGPSWGAGVRQRVRMLLMTLLRDRAILLRNMKESCCQVVLFCEDIAGVLSDVASIRDQ